MNTKETNKSLIAYLKQFVTPARLQKIESVLQLRTRHIAVVVETVFQPHNINAIMRSCEGFGIQDIHCITDSTQQSFVLKKNIALGSSQWLTAHYYKKTPGNNHSIHAPLPSDSLYHQTSSHPTIDCINTLKQKGYRIIATSPHATTTLSQLSIDTPLALVFGTEDTGLSQEALSHADETVSIPMFGFTESFNVSVSTALCLYDVTTKLRQSTVQWRISEDEKITLLLHWLRASIDRVESHERLFFNKQH